MPAGLIFPFDLINPGLTYHKSSCVAGSSCMVYKLFIQDVITYMCVGEENWRNARGKSIALPCAIGVKPEPAGDYSVAYRLKQGVIADLVL